MPKVGCLKVLYRRHTGRTQAGGKRAAFMIFINVILAIRYGHIEAAGYLHR